MQYYVNHIHDPYRFFQIIADLKLVLESHIKQVGRPESFCLLPNKYKGLMTSLILINVDYPVLSVLYGTLWLMIGFSTTPFLVWPITLYNI